MWKRRRTWLLLVALIAIALAVYFEPTHCVRGWLWGEAFFEGRPTSYWRSVIEADIRGPDPWDDGGGATFWESFCEKCGVRTKRQRAEALITPKAGDAVLADLKQDRSPRVRAFAEKIIDYNTNELPRLAETTWTCGTDTLVRTIAWHRAVLKARAVADNE